MNIEDALRGAGLGYKLPQLKNETFRIVSLSYFPFVPQEEVVLRPYVVNATSAGFDAITERIIMANGGKINESAVADVSNQILMPSTRGTATPMDQYFMNQPRLIFMLVAESRGVSGIVTKSYIHGYTDTDDITEVNVAPDLNHVIHSVIETTVREITTPMGLERSEKFSKIYELVNSHGGASQVWTQRPKDILGTMKTNNYVELLSDVDANHYGTEDTGMFGSTQAQGFTGQNRLDAWINPYDTNKVDNNIVTSYLSGVINEGLQNYQSTVHNFDTSSFTDTNNLISVTAEHELSDNRFLHFLSLIQGDRHLVSNEFSFKSLCQIDPSVNDHNQPNHWNLFLPEYDPTDPMSQITDIGESWWGEDPVTPLAQHLLTSAIAMASKYGFHKLIFDMDNQNTFGTSEYAVVDFGSFVTLSPTGGDPYQYLLDIILSRYMTEVFNPATMHGQTDLYVRIFVDMVGISRIYVEFAGFPGIWKTAATVTFNYGSPIVTSDADTLNYTSRAIRDLIDDVNDNVKRPVTNHHGNRFGY